MKCSAHCCAIDAQFGRRVAQRDLKNYRRNGPSPSTRQLLSVTRQAGVAGATVLDIGRLVSIDFGATSGMSWER